ncbi:MAG: dynamin family protein, partial [Ilumatobacteraceae bacterium]
MSLDLPGADEAREQAASAVRQLDDYVLPRLRDVDAPVLTVVGGSTGAGKSTLVNGLVGDEVSRPGVLRPTTRSPVLVHHPDAASWFDGDRILPGLARVRGGSTEGSRDEATTGHIELVTRETVPATLAVIDAPDIDSVVDANRAAAAQLLDAADLWVFVTTAARYADAVPWEFLRRAVARGVGIALVLNRVPPRSRMPFRWTI